MSIKKPLDNLGQILFVTQSGEDRVMTISVMNCEKHNDTTTITDYTGSDWCVQCLEEELNV